MNDFDENEARTDLASPMAYALAAQASTEKGGRQKKRSLPALVLFTLLTFFLAAPSWAREDPQPMRTVLVLSVAGTEEPFVYALTSSLLRSLNEDGFPRVRFLYESLPLPTINSRFKRTHLKDWFSTKYATENIDVILTIGYNPLTFALENRGNFWNNAPIIFTAVPRPLLKTLDISTNVTGISSERSIRSIADLTKRLFPEAQRLVVIGERLEKVDFRSYFTAEVSSASNILPITDLRGDSLETVVRRLKEIPPSSVVYFSRLNDDGSGRYFSSESVLRYIKSITPAPILVNNQTLMIDGVLGSSSIDIANLACGATKLIDHVLKTGQVQDIPAYSQVDTLSFNWPELERWSVPLSRLPPNSTVLGYQKSFWEQYDRDIFIFSLSILTLTGLIIALLCERRNKALAIKRSRKYLNEIAHLNRNITATIYAATIAHELNQPLAALSANTDTLELYLEKEQPMLRQALEVITDLRNDQRRASELIKKLRKMAKKEDNEFSPINIVQVIDDTLKFLAPEIKMRRARVRTMFSSPGIWINGDPVQIQQVLTNLIINSLDAMSDPSNPLKKIDIEVNTQDRLVNVSIRDSGTGFDTNIHKIFESFFTTKKHGLGLGLAITASIIEDHAGHISAANCPEGGAHVQFSLPRLDMPAN